MSVYQVCRCGYHLIFYLQVLAPGWLSQTSFSTVFYNCPSILQSFIKCSERCTELQGHPQKPLRTKFPLAVMGLIFVKYFQLWKTEYITNKTTSVSGLFVCSWCILIQGYTIHLPTSASNLSPPHSTHLPSARPLCLTSGALLAP